MGSISVSSRESPEDEDRWITIGQSLSGSILVVVHTYRKIKGKTKIKEKSG